MLKKASVVQVVSVPAFHFDDPSSNLPEIFDFSVNFVLRAKMN